MEIRNWCRFSNNDKSIKKHLVGYIISRIILGWKYRTSRVMQCQESNPQSPICHLGTRWAALWEWVLATFAAKQNSNGVAISMLGWDRTLFNQYIVNCSQLLFRGNMQYWYIDGKYRIYAAKLRNGGKTSFNHINFILTINTPILYLSCNKISKTKILFNLSKEKR